MKPIEMRDAFFERVVDLAIENEHVFFLTADHAAFSLKRYREKLPDRYINVGISEMNMIGVASGLALQGKVAFAYGIAPFVSLKVMEQIAIDAAAMNLSVNIISVGAGFTYSTDGPTHHGLQDLPAVLTIPNVTILNSSDPLNTAAFAQIAVSEPGTKYIRIEKGAMPCLPRLGSHNFKSGVSKLKEGSDLAVVVTGSIAHEALAASLNVEKNLGLSVRVIDLYRLKPLPSEALLDLLGDFTHVVTVEENYLSGGIGNLLASLLMEANLSPKFLRIGVKDMFCFDYSERDDLRSIHGVCKGSIASKICEWMSVS